MPPAFRSCSTATPATATSTTCAGWCASSSSAASPPSASRTSCIPKTNSFIDGDKQQLADIDEFCSRIKAGKDAQADDDFAIITRVEAFIAGWGLGEAMRRAEAYHAAGSDGILIHSALAAPDRSAGLPEGVGRTARRW